MRLWEVASGQCLAKVQDFQSRVSRVQWVETSDANYVAAGCTDGSLGLWKVVVDGDQYELRLWWRTTMGELTVESAINSR